MTEQDQAGPQLVADGPDPERFREVDIPGQDLGDVDAIAANIAKATARLRAKREEKRQRKLDAEMDAERRLAIAENRKNALRGVAADGEVFAVRGPESARYAALFFTQCACKWHGIRVPDPEVALREYDAHPCTIPLDLEDDHPAFRELKLGPDGRLVKRPPSVLALNLVMPDGTIINTITRPAGVEESAPVTSTTTEAADDTAARMALLELK